MTDNEDFHKSILDNLYDGVYFVDQERRITYWNKGAERISGHRSEQVLGSLCYNNILQHVNESGERLCTSACPLAKTIEDGQNREVDVFLHHINGQRVPVTVRVSPIRDSSGTITGAVEVFSDNSAKLSALEKVSELQRDAYIDALTETGNRRYTEIRLHDNLKEYRLQEMPFGVIFLDIDHFKDVNDTYGHNTGDRVLVMVARTITRNLQSYDFIGRWGGDELMLILPNATEARLESTAQTMLNLIAESQLPCENGPVSVTLSAGVTLARAEDDMLSLVDRADRLLYQSKQAGRNRITVG